MTEPQDTPQTARMSTDAGLRLIQNLRRQVETRYRDSLVKLNLAERLVAVLGTGGKGDSQKYERAEQLFGEIIRVNGESPLMSVSFGPAAPWEQRVPLVTMVREAVETFADEEFTVGDLCRRIRELYPDNDCDRLAVSKRLYDLRMGTNALVATVKLTTPMKENRYRLRPRPRSR